MRLRSCSQRMSGLFSSENATTVAITAATDSAIAIPAVVGLRRLCCLVSGGCNWIDIKWFREEGRKPARSPVTTTPGNQHLDPSDFANARENLLRWPGSSRDFLEHWQSRWDQGVDYQASTTKSLS